MTIQEIYAFVNFMANKAQSGAISPDEFNAACAVINIEFLKERVGLPEDYKVGQYESPIAYQVTQKITDDVRYFIEETTITKSGGYFAYPSDYFAWSSMLYKYTKNTCGEPVVQERWVESITDGELTIRKNNSIINPTLDAPVCAFYSDGMKIFPKEIERVSLTYLRKPATPFRNYTVVDGFDIYNPVGSTQFEYPESTHPDICSRILKYYGINIREADLINFAANRIERGQ